MKFLTGLTDLVVTFSRSEAISFSFSITEQYNQLFIKKSKGAYNFEAYTEPMQKTCWISIGIFFVVTPCILYWTTKYAIWNKYIYLLCGVCFSLAVENEYYLQINLLIHVVYSRITVNTRVTTNSVVSVFIFSSIGR